MILICRNTIVECRTQHIFEIIFMCWLGSFFLEFDRIRYRRKELCTIFVLIAAPVCGNDLAVFAIDRIIDRDLPCCLQDHNGDIFVSGKFLYRSNTASNGLIPLVALGSNVCKQILCLRSIVRQALEVVRRTGGRMLCSHEHIVILVVCDLLAVRILYLDIIFLIVVFFDCYLCSVRILVFIGTKGIPIDRI